MRKLKPILLVGSVPLADAEAVFRMLASKLGTRAKRYPDGETGHRTNWIRWQRHVFERHPNFELENPDPSIAGIKDSQARPIFKLKDKRADIVLGALGYAKEAILSYSTFSRLKQSGSHFCSPFSHPAECSRMMGGVNERTITGRKVTRNEVDRRNAPDDGHHSFHCASTAFRSLERDGNYPDASQAL